jgi:hypothetical protein
LIENTPLISLVIQAYKHQASLKVQPLGGQLDQKVSYMGHLTLICDLICKLKTEEESRLPAGVAAVLSSSDWNEFIGTYYVATKNIESKILGGSQPPQQPSSRSLYEEGNCLFYSQEEMDDFEFDSLESEQLSRMIIGQLARALPEHFSVDYEEDEDESENEQEITEEERLSNSFGLIFNNGLPK